MTFDVYKNIPQWNWFPIEVENLDKIQQEILTTIKYVFPNYEQMPPGFYYLNNDTIKELCQNCNEFLKKINLFDRWCNTSIVTTNFGRTIAIHTDAENYKERSFALNIPIINCNDTYTVWYDVGTAETSKHETLGSIVYSDYNAVEIDRMPSSTCAFVNVMRPHRPVTNHSNFRALVSFRFYPELFDYFKN